MNGKKLVKPPGIITRIISCIPMFNWLSLIIIGLKCRALISLACGILYGWISFIYYDWAPLLWVITIFQYNVVYCFYDVEPPKTRNRKSEKKTSAKRSKQNVVDTREKETKTEVIKEVEEKKHKELELDFEKIGNLRKESDYVRTALEVDS